MDFAVPADHRVKLKENEKRDKYLDLARELKKTMEYESDGDANCKWCARYCHQRIYTGTGERKNKRTSGDYPNYSIIKIVQNTEKSPGDLRRFAVTQDPSGKPSANAGVKNSQRSKIMKIKTIQNSKCRLCGDRDATINHIISECRKLAQKEYKTRHDWVGKVIH